MFEHYAHEPQTLEVFVNGCGAPHNWNDPVFIANKATVRCRVDWFKTAIEFGILQHPDAVFNFFAESLSNARSRQVIAQLRYNYSHFFEGMHFNMQRKDTEEHKLNVYLLGVLIGRERIINDALIHSAVTGQRIIECAAFTSRNQIVLNGINRDPTSTRAAKYMAALAGDRDLLQRLIDIHPVISTQEWCGAARGGHIDMLMWLNRLRTNPQYKTIFIFNHIIYECAAASGEVNILKWLRYDVLKTPFYDSVWIKAVEKGHLSVLQWLRDPSEHNNGQPVPWLMGLCELAVRNNNMELLKWLRNTSYHNGDVAPWGDACRAAVLNNNVEMIEYMFDDSYHNHDIAVWDENFHCRLAVESHCVKIIDWAIDNERCSTKLLKMFALTSRMYHTFEYVEEREINHLARKFMVLNNQGEVNHLKRKFMDLHNQGHVINDTFARS